jgi:DNA-binding SARP family transcriptional activator
MAMRIDVLGPLRVRIGDRDLPVTARRERVLLAMLVLHANRAVPLPELVDAVWHRHRQPPKDARSQLQGCVCRLRRALSGSGGPAAAIITDPAGYRLQIDPRAVDMCEFHRLRDQARAAAAGRRAGEASQRYRAALGLWRGSAFSGVDSDRVRDAAGVLAEERVLLLEECVRLELDLGRAGELVGELSELLPHHPYREGLYGALMLALYRAGRPADALATYRRADQLLRDELGTEPGGELQRLHRAILNRDPELAPPGRPAGGPAGRPPPPPRELPHEAAGFTGRLAALAELDRLLPDRRSGDPAPVPIAVVTGPAGVGKTALGVYWAHRVAGRFPDGQLYRDLRGHDPDRPVPPAAALAALLRSLGIPAPQVPADPAEAAALYRSRLAGRRVLVVLDNAATAEQVRPLVPGAPGCFVLVTSRDRLTGLAARDGASRLVLDVLPPAEAWAMIARGIGGHRARAEREAVSELAKLCSHLPLALRIAAANLADHPGRSVAGYVAELARGDRLAALRAEGDQQSAVLGAFQLSYQVLPAPAQRLFRRVGLVPGPDFTAPVAAAVAGCDAAEAERVLGTLAAVHLVDEPVPGRFALHDLLRRYADQLVDAEDGAPARAAAVDRLLGGYLRTADSASQLLDPQSLRLPLRLPQRPPLARLDRVADALAWLDTERANLVAAVGHAAATDQPPAWLLADRLRCYLSRGQHTVDWLATARAAAGAADRAGDLPARAACQFSLGHAHQCLARFPTAIAHYTAAYALAGQAGWVDGQAATLNNLGLLYQEQGRPAGSADHHLRALALNRERGAVGYQAVNRVNLADVERQLGRLRQAADDLNEALALSRRLGYRHGEAVAGGSLGHTYRALGQLGPARERLTEALARYRETGDRAGESATLQGLAAVHRDAGRYPAASEHATRAAAVAAEIGDHRRESDALRTLGSVQLRLGRLRRALAHHRSALALARRANSAFAEIAALIELAGAHHRNGEPGPAGELAGQALERARTSGYRVLEGSAASVLAEIQLAQPDLAAAEEHAGRALELHRATGCRLGEAEALRVLGLVRRAAGDRAAAAGALRAARGLFEEVGAPVPAVPADPSGPGRR